MEGHDTLGGAESGMAFGEHWEWRGFGRPVESLIRSIRSLPLKFPQPQEVTDTYLWVPGCSVNVKLRFEDLKFKRRLDARDGFERWLEDEAENHRFPLAPAVLEELKASLGISLRGVPAGAVDREKLEEIVKAAHPPVHFVRVEKLRWQYSWDDEGACSGQPVTVELAEIRRPETITSIGIEHPGLEALEKAHRLLGLELQLRGISYLEAISIWAAGGTIRDSA